MNSSRGRKLLGTLGLLVLLIYVAGVFTAGYAAGTTVAASARPASGSMSASARAGKTSAAPSVTSTASAAATAGAATPSPTPTGSPAPGLPVSAAAPGTLTISMLTRGSAFGYAPASASIPAGTTVRWVNASSAPHTVTGFGVDSGIIPVGGQFTYTFSRPGTYTYSCMLHPGMTGVIVVYAATAGRPVPPPPPVPTPQPAPILPPPPPAPGVAAVTMTQGADFAFSPATLTVPLGTTVRWTNATSAPHTVTAAGFDSGTIPSGGTYSHTFTQAGAFSYHCAFHPNMTGTIIVSGTATPPPSATPPPTSAAAQVQLIKNDGDYSFAPAALSIKVGTVVTWLNTTGDTLTVDGASFHSAPMAREGGTWSHLFTTPGTYTYSSSLRPEMSGTIIVSA